MHNFRPKAVLQQKTADLPQKTADLSKKTADLPQKTAHPPWKTADLPNITKTMTMTKLDDWTLTLTETHVIDTLSQEQLHCVIFVWTVCHRSQIIRCVQT